MHYSFIVLHLIVLISNVKYLHWDETLFKDAEVFDADYLPDALLHREMHS